MYEGLFNHFFEVIPDRDDFSIDYSLNKIDNDNEVFSFSESKPKISNNNIKLFSKGKRKKLELTFCEKVIGLYFCNKKCIRKENKVELLFYNGKSKICSYLETSNYLLKIHQVDMIKKYSMKMKK